jgi:signal recognition particle GTPase
MLASLSLLLATAVQGYSPACTAPRVPFARPAVARVPSAVRMDSLASKMFGDVFGGLKSAAEAAQKAVGGEEEEREISAPVKGDDVVADLDARAQTGALTFDDFLTMSSAFENMGSQNIPGMPKLSATELAETKAKFAAHEQIVEVMMDDERADPSLLIDDLKEGASKPGPRIQRLATASGQAETDVALFLMQFEAMRESTRRIAEGEDPDTVNESIAPPGANRKVRRAAAKKKKMKKK